MLKKLIYYDLNKLYIILNYNFNIYQFNHATCPTKWEKIKDLWAGSVAIICCLTTIFCVAHY